MLRGIFLSAGLPLLLCLVWAAVQVPSMDMGALRFALRDALDQLAGLYLQYPVLAIGLHLALFAKGMFRPRYRTSGPSLMLLLLIAGGAWFGLSKMGADPTAMVADTFEPQTSGINQHGIGVDSRPSAKAPPPPVLFVPAARPNLLGQHVSSVIQSVDMYPSTEGAPAASGYLGSAPAVFELYPSSQVSAASASLASYASQPCEPRTSFVGTTQVTGCIAWVQDAFIGPVPLPKMSVFFTQAVPGTKVILGAPVMAALNLTKSSSGMVTLRLKPGR